MMRTMAIWLVAAMAWVGAAQAGLPETPRLRQITVADGMPSNNVQALAEDGFGYLWIGTADGLARYDGVGYRIWRKEDGLPDHEIAALQVGADNRLWIATGHGLAVLDVARREFSNYNTGNSPQMGSDIVWSLAETPDGAIWFGTGNAGLHRIAADGTMTRFMPRQGDPRSLPSPSVPLLEVAPDGTLWIGTRGGVARWTGRDFETIPGTRDEPVPLRLRAGQDGRLWIGRQQGVNVYEPVSGRLSPAPWGGPDTPERIYSVVLRDRAGLYWLDTRDGLAVADSDGVSLVKTYSELRQGVVKPNWTAGHEDRGGGLWFASDDSGLWYLPPNWRQFSVLMHRPDEPESLGNVDVTAIAPAADGSMWLVGNSGVLDLLDTETGEVEHVYRDSEDYVPMQVLEGSDGAVWVAFLGGLGRYDRDSGRMRLWRAGDPEQPALAGDSAGLAESGDGLIWAASNHWGVQARDAGGRIRETVAAGEGRGLEKETRLTSIGRAPDGGVWVAGSQGLLMWNAGGRWLEPVPGAPQELVDAFALQGQERVWLIRTGALESYRWDGAALTRLSRFDAGDGMPQIDFRGVTVDAGGIVWVTGMRGLVRVDPEQRTVNVFGIGHGLPAQEILSPPVPRPYDGRILLATTAGLVIYNPVAVRPDAEVPALVVETAQVRGRDGMTSLDIARPFRLSHEDRDLQVVARLLSFNEARRNTYRFRLHGYDPDWVVVGASGERVFPRLEPGDYRLEIAARTPLSPWSEPQSVMFSVAAPWWRSWWARATGAFAALLLAWWAVLRVRRRLHRRLAWQRVQHEREVARQASEAKTRFLATLGHEVRTPMTGVLGMSELLLETPLDSRQRGYTESIQRAGEHLMRLVNDALDLARIEAGRLELDPQPFDLELLLQDVVAFTAPLARQRGLQFRERVAADLPRGLHGDAVRVRQILLNLLNNAIKFTESGYVELRVEARQPEGIRLVVSDTGPGLNEQQQQRLFRRFEQADGARTAARYGGSGLGLAICQELAAGMGGRIEVDSVPGQGARFTVELPLPGADIAAQPSVASEAAMPASGCRVLLVEDDATVAEVIAGLLRTRGYEATHAGHGLAALAEVAGGDFDAALLDLDLPSMDGIALARQLRVQGHRFPLIAVTARADADAESSVRAAGFDAFLRKPVSGAVLAETIEGVLHRSGDMVVQDA